MNEEDGHQVVAHVELHPRVFERFEAALIGGILRRVGTVGTEQETEDLGCHSDCHPHHDEEDDGQIGFQVHGGFVSCLVERRCKSRSKRLVPTARLELAQLSPLPPQDSVSTNFTTSATRKNIRRAGFGLHEDWLSEQP